MSTSVDGYSDRPSVVSFERIHTEIVTARIGGQKKEHLQALVERINGFIATAGPETTHGEIMKCRDLLVRCQQDISQTQDIGPQACEPLGHQFRD